MKKQKAYRLTNTIISSIWGMAACWSWPVRDEATTVFVVVFVLGLIPLVLDDMLGELMK